jgi:hypothetical protein
LTAFAVSSVAAAGDLPVLAGATVSAAATVRSTLRAPPEGLMESIVMMLPLRKIPG